MLCSSAKICIQTWWLLMAARVLDQTDQILAKNQKSIQGKIQEASRKYPYENCCFQMPQKPKAKCVLENAYLLSLWSFCTIKSFFIHATSFLRPNILDFSIAQLVRNNRASLDIQIGRTYPSRWITSCASILRTLTHVCVYTTSTTSNY